MLRYILYILLLVPCVCSGQRKNLKKDSTSNPGDTLSHIHLLARNYGDSIVLRWAPGDAVTWILSQKRGFMVQRTTYKKEIKGNFKAIKIDSFPVRPWSLQQWGEYFNATGDSLSAMAAELMYGKKTPFKMDSLSLFSILNKYREQKNRYVYAMLISDFNANVANGFGMRFADRATDRSSYYTYSVYPVDSANIIHSDTALVFVSGNIIYKPEKAPAVQLVSGDKRIHLFWYNNLPKTGYSGFYIERSEDGKNFKRLNKFPYVYVRAKTSIPKPLEYIDSGLVNYKKYYYRVIGISPFSSLSLPSAVQSAIAKDLTPPAPPLITRIKNTGADGKIHFHWEKTNKEADFKGYIVGRSANLKGPFEPLNNNPLSFDTHNFTDEHPNTNAPNFYIVAAIDTANNAGRSMPAYMNAEDHTPPSQPTGLTGNIDSTGKVSIHWNWNNENDLAGYKIFFSNSAKDIFTPIGVAMLTDTLFTDSITLKTLTKNIFYRVIAYDRNMNASPVSEILKLKKPDIIPPIATIIHGFNVTDTGVSLQWYKSASEDAASQKLYRKKDSTDIWTILATLTATDTAFTDTTVKSLHHYAYVIETVDSSGLSSGHSFPLKVYVYNKGYSNTIKNFTVKLNKNKAMLSWTSSGEDVNYYILYRGRNDTGLKMAGNIAGDKLNYEETIDKGNYKFAIKAIYKNGKESAVSEIKTLVAE